MIIELIDNFKDFLLLEDVWNNILSKSKSEQVFSTFEWFSSWWLAFGQNLSLCVLLVKEKDSIIGIAPLMLQKAAMCGLRFKKLSFIYNDNASHADFLLMAGREREGVSAIVDYLKSGRIAYDVLEFQNMPKESPNYELLLEKLSHDKAFFVLKEGLRSPYIPIAIDWQAYLLSLSKKFRKTLHNIQNRAKSEKFRIEKVEDSIKNKGILNSIVGISEKSWKAKCNGEISHSRENVSFFQALSKIATEKGWLGIWLLTLRDKPIAYEYLLKYKEKIYALRADYDDAYKLVSPGLILNVEGIRSSFEEKIKEYDFCGHDEEYKKKWTSSIRGHYHIIMYNGFYARIIYLLDYVIYYNTKEFLKKFESAVKFKKTLRRINLK